MTKTELLDIATAFGFEVDVDRYEQKEWIRFKYKRYKYLPDFIVYKKWCEMTNGYSVVLDEFQNQLIEYGKLLFKQEVKRLFE